MDLSLLTSAVSLLAIALFVLAWAEDFERIAWDADGAGEVFNLLVTRSGAGLAVALRFGGVSFLYLWQASSAESGWVKFGGF